MDLSLWHVFFFFFWLDVSATCYVDKMTTKGKSRWNEIAQFGHCKGKLIIIYTIKAMIRGTKHYIKSQKRKSMKLKIVRHILQTLASKYIELSLQSVHQMIVQWIKFQARNKEYFYAGLTSNFCETENRISYVAILLRKLCHLICWMPMHTSGRWSENR